MNIIPLTAADVSYTCSQGDCEYVFAGRLATHARVLPCIGGLHKVFSNNCSLQSRKRFVNFNMLSLKILF